MTIWGNFASNFVTHLIDMPPRLPVNKNYPDVNAAAQEGRSGSHLEIFRSLLALRKDMSYSSLSGDVWSGQDVLAFGTTGDDGDAKGNIHI